MLWAATGFAGLMLLEERLPPAVRPVAALLLIPIHPLAAAVAAAVVGYPWISERWGIIRHREPAGDAVLLADLMVLGLGAGLTVEGALREAAPDLPPAMAAEVRLLLRETRRRGVGAALAAAAGSGERLYRITGRAVASGAAVGQAVEALARELRHAEHTRALAEARRLPVRMLLPLALLILPGFVLLVVGPALIGSLARLDIGW
jgi:hypothetical protein